MTAKYFSVVMCLFTFVTSFAFANNPPSIDLGSDITALAGSKVQLNATVADPDEDDISVVWKVLYSPAGSRKEFSSFSGETTEFTLDRIGTYVIEAEVRDQNTSTKDLISIYSSESAGEVVFGPVQNIANPFCINIDSPKCKKETYNFDVLEPGNDYTLIVKNNNFVSVSIKLNGERVTSFYDFSGREENLAINLNLALSNQLEVIAIGNPTASIEVSVKKNLQGVDNNTAPTLSIPSITYFGNSLSNTTITSDPNDLDQTIRYEILEQPNNGSVTIEGDNLFFQTRTNLKENGQATIAVFDDGTPEKVAVQRVDVLFDGGNRAPVVRGSMEVTSGEPVFFEPIIEDNVGDEHTITIDTQPAGGNVVLGNDNVLVFYPNDSFVGNVSFLITVTDDQVPQLSTQYQVVGSVLENNPPTLSGVFNLNTPQGNTVSTKFTGNDSNPGQGTVISIFDGPSFGNAEIINGELKYTPLDSFFGTDSITLRVRDTAFFPKFQDYEVLINVAENSSPLVSGSPFSRTLNVGQEFGQVVFFQDANVNQVHTLEIVKTPIGGNAVLEGRFLTYTANSNFIGKDEIVVKITDNGNPVKSTLAVIQLEVKGNTPPNPNVQWIRQSPDNIPSSTFVDFNLLVNDPDTSQTHVIEVIDPPVNGTITPNVFWDNRFSYRSSDGYNGPDSFRVRVTDSGEPALSVEKEFSINVITNRPPAPRDYEIAVLAGLQKRVTIWDNDPDRGQTHTYEITQAPTQGNAVLDGIGLVYTANTNSVGTDEIKVTVRDSGIPSEEAVSTISVTFKENTAPAFTPITTPPRIIKNTERSIWIRYRDVDEADGQVVAKSIASQPQNGTVEIISTTNGSIRVKYTPNQDFLGFDSFNLRAVDNGIPALEDVTNVVVEVVENNAPVISIAEMSGVQGYGLRRGFVSVTDPDNSRFTYGVFAQPVGGTVNVDQFGRIFYSPNRGFFGVDQVGIIVTEFDGGVDGLSTTGVMTVNIQENLPPNPQDSVIETFQSRPIGGRLTDGDPNSGDIRGRFEYNVINFPENGTLELSQSSGSYTYTPAPGFSGQDTFTYRVLERPTLFDDTLQGEATVTINVIGNVNPTIDLTNISLVAGESVVTDFNVIDPDSGQILNVEILNDGQFGNTEIAAINNDTYRIWYNSTSFQGNDEITLKISDNAIPNGVNEVVIPVQVEENFPPVISPLSLSVLEGESVTGQISFTDVNQGQSYTYSIVSQPSFGVAEISDSGLLSYTPAQGSTSDDNVTVRITDTSFLAISSEIVIPIDVIPNTVPVLSASPSSIDTFQSESASTQISFTDPDQGQSHTYGIQVQPTNGSAVISQTGLLNYTPNTGFSGSDSLTVFVDDSSNPPGRGTLVISINVTQNSTPVLTANPPTIETFQSTPISGVITFSDPDSGQSHTYSIINGGSKGNTVINQTGNFTYTPSNGEFGNDSIEFSVTDSANPPAIGTITVPVSITPNTSPVILGESNLATFQSTAIESIYEVTDIDQGQDLTLSVASNPTNGFVNLVRISNSDQYRVNYQPNTGYTGSDSFSLTARDNANPNGETTLVVSVNVEANTAPVVDNGSLAFVQSDNPKTLQITFFDPDLGQNHVYNIETFPTKGSASINSTGLLTYSPSNGESGLDSLVVSVRDNANPAGLGTATISIAIDPNSAPVLPTIADITLRTSSNRIIDVTATDINPNQFLSYQLTQFPSEVSAFLNPFDGSLEISAGANYVGPDSLEITVSDDGNPILVDSQVVNINVTQGNSAPAPQNQDLETLGGVRLEYLVLPNDPDVEDSHTFSIIGPPSNGTANIDSNGLLIYDSNSGYVGPDSIDIQVTDSGDPNLSGTATININVKANSAPNPIGDSIDLLAGRSIDLVVNPNDPDSGQTFTFEIVNLPSTVVATIDNQGNLNIQSSLVNFGQDTVVVRVSDDGNPSLSGEASYAVNVIENTPPTVNNGSAVISKNEVLQGDLDWFDNNQDIQTFTFNVAQPSSNGVVTISSSGFLTYTPDTDFVGQDSFTIRVTDDSGQFGEGTINVDVTDGNTPPVVTSLGYSLRDPNGPYSIRFRLRAEDSDGEVVRAEWNFGDGSPISNIDKNIVGENRFGRIFHNYSSEGNYDVTVTVFDNDGSSSQFTRNINVTGGFAPAPRFNVSSLSGSAPLNLSFDGTSSFDPDGTVDYIEWYVPQTDQYIVGPTASLNFPNPGIYTVDLYIEDNNRTASFLSIPVFVDEPQFNLLPFFNFASSYSQSDTLPLVVTTSVSGEIDFDGSIIDIAHYAGERYGPELTFGTTADHSYGVPGTYQSKILVRDDSGEGTLKTRFVHAGPAEDPAMAILPIQVGPLEVEFDAIIKGHYNQDSFLWDLGDGNWVSGLDIRHTYANPGDFTVRVFYFDVYGRLAEVSHSFFIDNNIYRPTVLGNLADYQEIALGDSVTLDLSSSFSPNGFPLIGFITDFSNLDIGNTGNDSTTYNTVGVHPVRAYVENDLGLYGRGEFFINVLNGAGPTPVASSDITTGPAPLSFTLDATSSSGNITKFQWKASDIRDEFGLLGGTTNGIETVTLDDPGFYNFELWVRDDLGNTRVDTIEIEVTN